MPKDTTNHPPDDELEKSTELLSHPELLQKLDETKKKADDNWERLLRMQADAENLQRRNEREIANAHKYALEKFASELLPIVDSLELSISNVPKDANQDSQAIIEGVELTLKMFYTSLEKFGIKQVNPINQPFNPEFEQAIAVQVDPAVKPGTVLSVLQKGYTLNNRLLRPALVTVSKAHE